MYSIKMQQFFVLVVLTTSTLSFVQVSSAENEDCGAVLTPQSTMNLSVSVLRNSSGDWITLFSAEKNIGVANNGVNIGIKHTVLKSGQTNIVRVSGVIRDAHSENFVDVVVPRWSRQEVSNETTFIDRKEDDSGVLRFYEITGKRIALINNARTAYRKDANQYHADAGLVTNRPLRDGEMFQVQLDKTINKWTNAAVYIGVCLQIPYYIKTDTYVADDYGNGTWSLYNNGVVMENKVINGSYPLSLKNLGAGTRIGVMRKKNTELHFFLNGVDNGVAAKYVPGPVYGIFDLVSYATQVSIVD